jgi:hypothetical protein
MIQIPFFIVNHTATMMLTIKRKSVNLFFAQQDVFNRSCRAGQDPACYNYKTEAKGKKK